MHPSFIVIWNLVTTIEQDAVQSQGGPRDAAVFLHIFATSYYVADIVTLVLSILHRFGDIADFWCS